MTHHVKTTDYSTISVQRVVPAALVPHRAQALAPAYADAASALDAALSQRDIQSARTVIAQAETAGVLADGALAMGKARIAFADGDVEATKAILVMGIERDPESQALRSLLAEVMVATGAAGEARSVLTHLGQAPVNPPKDPLARPGSLPTHGHQDTPLAV